MNFLKFNQVLTTIKRYCSKYGLKQMNTGIGIGIWIDHGQKKLLFSLSQ